MNLQQRSLPICVILSIVTCGIYAFYWVYVLDMESKQLADTQNSTSSGLVVILSIVTCGIYYIYWQYMMGKRMADAQGKYNLPVNDRSLVYLLLAIFSLSIVSLALIQDDINNLVSSGN